MIIDNPNALKQWLAGYLPPLCDANPEVLAKYCLALVKKNRPEEELKASLIEQLDVFLKSNTEMFVEKYLEVARSKAYISEGSSSPVKSSGEEGSNKLSPPSTHSAPGGKTAESSNGVSPEITESSTTTQPALPATQSLQPPLPPLPPPILSIPYPPPETTPPYPPPKKEELPVPPKMRKSESERERGGGDREERRAAPRASRPRAGSRVKDGSSNKSRSRSRDRERTRRSRSPRGRPSRSKYEDRRGRRGSPPPSHVKRYSRRSRTRSRSPRWSRSPARRSRSRERRSRSRNRSRSVTPKRHVSRHKSRTRSPKPLAHPAESPTLVSSSRKSPPAKGDEKEHSPSPEASSSDPPMILSVVSIPNQDRCTAPKSQRCRDYDEQGFCLRGDLCPFDHGADPFVLEGGSLDFPPPITGVPPITPVAGVGYPVPAPQSIPQEMPGRLFMRHLPPPRPAQFGEYTPSNPGLWGNDSAPPSNPYYGGRGRGIAGMPPRFPGPPPPMAPMDKGRELISVPVNGANQGKPGGIRSSLAQRLGPATNNLVSSSGAYPGAPPQGGHGTKYSNSSDNRTLELRKVPPGLNTIALLNQHFAKFGTITNIQVHHERDPEAALVTFSSHSEANAAYRSTEAVLNNRFIKLFWHNAIKGEVPSSTTNLQRSVHDRLGLRNPNKSLNNRVQSMEVAPSLDTEKVVMVRGGLVKTVINRSTLPTGEEAEDAILAPTESSTMEGDKPSEGKPHTVAAPDSTQHPLTTVDIKKQEREAIRKQQELLKAEITAKQKLEKQKAEAIKLKNEVENRTRQLLQEQMQHVKLLISKLEKNRASMKPEEIKVLLDTIKSLQAAVETTKAQLAASTPATHPVTTPALPKTRAQLDKEILDTELELYTLQSEGGDVTQVSVRLQKLKTQALQFRVPKHQKGYPVSTQRGITPAKVLGRGRGVLRGRGRGRSRQFGGSFNAVDRRSTCINASGFEREDKEEVLAHFAALGTVVTYAWDKLTPAIAVQYANRRDAEKAMSEGRNLGDRLLTLTWASEVAAGPSPPPIPVSSPGINTAAGGLNCLQKNVRAQQGAMMISSSNRSNVIGNNSLSHSTSDVAQDDEEEITEEIVEEVETEEIGSYIFEDELEEEEEEGDEGTRSWRR